MSDKFKKVAGFLAAKKIECISAVVLIAIIAVAVVSTQKINTKGDTVSIEGSVDEVVTVDGEIASDIDEIAEVQNDKAKSNEDSLNKDENEKETEQKDSDENSDNNDDNKDSDKKTDNNQSNKIQINAYKTCKVAITCQPFMDDCSDSVKAMLPTNGTIIGSTTVEFVQGETAYDVLVRICNAKGIPLTASNSVYGAYVSSIDNLSEKYYDYSTGWCYSVNGVLPNVSSSSYKLKQGDTIVWMYDAWSF